MYICIFMCISIYIYIYIYVYHIYNYSLIYIGSSIPILYSRPAGALTTALPPEIEISDSAGCHTASEHLRFPRSTQRLP